MAPEGDFLIFFAGGKIFYRGPGIKYYAGEIIFFRPSPDPSGPPSGAPPGVKAEPETGAAGGSKNPMESVPVSFCNDYFHRLAGAAQAPKMTCSRS